MREGELATDAPDRARRDESFQAHDEAHDDGLRERPAEEQLAGKHRCGRGRDPRLPVVCVGDDEGSHQNAAQHEEDRQLQVAGGDEDEIAQPTGGGADEYEKGQRQAWHLTEL